MTWEQLQALITEGESLTLEFKRDAPLSDSEIAEAVVCLANTEGGTLVLGIEKDGSSTGLHSKRFPVRPHLLEALIANRTVPGVRVQVELVTGDEATVAVIRVDRSNHIVQTSDGRALRRMIVGKGEPECRPLQPAEIASRLSYLGQLDYTEQLLSQATWADFDPLEFERLRQEVDRNARSDETLAGLSDEELVLALQLGVRREDRIVPTVGGLLLVGRERAIREFVPTHEAAFQELGQDLSVAFNEFYRSPLLKLFRHFEQLLAVRNREEELMLGFQRIGVPLYPMDAVREAIANALTHRDYTLLHAVHVRIDPSEGGLVISNPGGFVEGVTLDNLLVTGPRPRNRVLADAFKRLGLVERIGRGIERIYADILGTGRPAPDYSGSDRSSVKVVIPGGPADLAFVRLVIRTSDRMQRPLGWQHLLTLRRAAEEGEITSAEIAALTQRDEAGARAFLEELVEVGLLEAKGGKRIRSYHLSAHVYEELGKPVEYLRRRGVEEIQQEQMVEQFVTKFGEIRRQDVLKLLPQLTKAQAYYLLRRMTHKGILEAVGEKRGRFYRPANRK